MNLSGFYRRNRGEGEGEREGRRKREEGGWEGGREGWREGGRENSVVCRSSMLHGTMVTHTH